MQLQNLRHSVWILPCRARTLGELLKDGLDLLICRTHSDNPVAELTRLLRRDWPRRCYVDRRQFCWERPESRALQLIPATSMLHLFPGEELADDLNRFKHARDAFANLWPVAAHHMLVKCLA